MILNRYHIRIETDPVSRELEYCQEEICSQSKLLPRSTSRYQAKPKGQEVNDLLDDCCTWIVPNT